MASSSAAKISYPNGREPESGMPDFTPRSGMVNSRGSRVEGRGSRVEGRAETRLLVIPAQAGIHEGSPGALHPAGRSALSSRLSALSFPPFPPIHPPAIRRQQVRRLRGFHRSIRVQQNPRILPLALPSGSCHSAL
jgi:hypothetical protein